MVPPGDGHLAHSATCTERQVLRRCACRVHQRVAVQTRASGSTTNGHLGDSTLEAMVGAGHNGHAT